MMLNEDYNPNNNVLSGRLITFEGIDGSGKSTQIKILADRLDELKVRYKIIREPGSTELSETVREILLNLKKDKDDMISPRAECLLFMAARAQLVAEEIIPGLVRGDLILCDRFGDSTAAYQGYGRGIPLIEIYKAEGLSQDGVMPDLRILIDTDLKISHKRISKGRVGRNRMERVNDAFRKRVRDGYLTMAQFSPNNWAIVDGDRSKEEVAALIYEHIAPFIGEVDVA